MNTTTKFTLISLDGLAKIYAQDRARMAEAVRNLEDDIAALKRRRLASIKTAAAKAADSQAALKAAIEGHPHLFVKPRTFSLHGIKVGFQKGKGKIEWADDERVVSLIRKHFADQADVLIATKETPVKDALKTLSVADLKRLGCSVEEAGDQIVIKAADSDVDKLVAAILEEGLKEIEEGA